MPICLLGGACSGWGVYERVGGRVGGGNAVGSCDLVLCQLVWVLVVGDSGCRLLELGATTRLIQALLARSAGQNRSTTIRDAPRASMRSIGAANHENHCNTVQ
jgi:hypothetical protein